MIPALERLRALRAGKSPGIPIACPDNLSMDWRIEFEERAAILQYDGRLSRDEADEQALQEICERMKRV